ncbi:hypothetical protein TNCV_2852711 [Trichonephila clavipes]|uniref:Uncharacterized protein n=1 Tax=Trichonephila clavipes TaxID=2585209 RepID=A0A8X6RC06_TRICX|nr:hypothetical protein TNCV_2852711 [Trichonephila clavipes]
MSSSSLDRGSKLQGSLIRALMLLYIVMLKISHSLLLDCPVMPGAAVAECSRYRIVSGLVMSSSPVPPKTHVGLGGLVPCKTLAKEEVDVTPVVIYNCDYCEYRSPTQKGLRCRRITVHRIGVGGEAHLGHPRAPRRLFWLDFPPDKKPSRNDTIKHVYVKRTFRSCSEDAVWTLHRIPWTAWPKRVISASICITSNQVSGCLDNKFSHISRCLDTIKCTYSVALQCLCCLDYKFSHTSHCLDTIKCTYTAALQLLFGLQV